MSNRTYLGKPSYNRVQWIKAHHASSLPDGLDVYFYNGGDADWPGDLLHSFSATEIDMSGIEQYSFDGNFYYVTLIDINNITSFTNVNECPNIGLFNVINDDGLSVKAAEHTFRNAMMNSPKLFYYVFGQYDEPPRQLNFNFADDTPGSIKGVSCASMREAIEINGMMQFVISNVMDYVPLHIQCSDGGLQYAVYSNISIPTFYGYDS